mgnify:CR=1 FL=1
MTLARGKNLNGYVIFKSPPGHDGKYVVRVRRMMGDEGVLEASPFAVAESLAGARAAIQNTDCILRMPPAPGDGPEVVETWV